MAATRTLIVRTSQAIGTIVAFVATFAAAALVAFGPITALPGELQTDFVNGSWVLPVGVGLFPLVIVLRLGPLARERNEPWGRSTLRFMWRFLSTFVAFFWLAGLLLWVNSFDVRASETHDMLVVGHDERRPRPGGSTIKHYKLAEIGTSWRADLQPASAREKWLEVGACTRLTVHPGRLGLNWISDVQPIQCHT